MADNASTTQWRTGWDAENPLNIQYNLVLHDEGAWESGPRAHLEHRDLGLGEATDGKMGARHIRFNGDTGSTGEWHFHDLDFQWFFVLKGTVKMRTEDGQDLTLEAGASAYQPPYWRHYEYSFSDDFEALEVTAPADFETIVGDEAPKPERAEEFAHLSAVYTDERPENYVRAEGPRPYFEYRDLGTRAPTDDRIHLHIVRSATEPMEGGTGDHHHSMSQWFMPISGWADIDVEGQESRRMEIGDFMCIQEGMTHNVTSYSRDYACLEMCVPAEYDTVND